MMKVAQMGYQFVNAGGFERNAPNGSGDYLFLYLRTPTEVNLDDTYVLLPARTYILFKKGSPQLYRKWDAHFINDWIHFDFDTYDSYFERLQIPFNTPLSLPNDQEIQDLTSDLFIEYFNSDANHEQIMSAKVDQLFRRFSQLYQFSQTHSARMNQYRSEFSLMRRQILFRQYCPDSIEEIAAHFHLSVSHFQHLYKSFFGHSVYHDIIQARMDQAAHLLEQTNYSIGEIADFCGYDNMEHFSRIFKKYHKLSPRNYRKQITDTN